MMKAMLTTVGVVLILDAGVTTLMLVQWGVRGHVPDFLTPTAFGVWSIVMIALKTAGGAAGAIQLWRLKPSGRLIAGVVAANNCAYTIVAAARAGAFSGGVWGTVALNAVMLVVVALPAAGDACRPAPRPMVRTAPRPRSMSAKAAAERREATDKTRIPK
jgi:hypothetical protein